MCFSPTASFAAGTVLLVVGTATVKKMTRRAELPYAMIPVLFGIQQIIEGIIWLTVQNDVSPISIVMTHIYSVFSHVLWPIYVPFAVLLLEPVLWRRKVIAAFLLVGAAVGVYLLYVLVQFPVRAEVIGGHIQYLSPHFYRVTVLAFYFAGACISALFSSHRLVNLFGILLVLSSVAAFAIYDRWFISVWCFFAALLSVVIYLYFRNTARSNDPHDIAQSLARTS